MTTLLSIWAKMLGKPGPKMLQINSFVSVLTTLPSLLTCFFKLLRNCKITKVKRPLSFFHTVPAKSLLSILNIEGWAGKLAEDLPEITLSGGLPPPPGLWHPSRRPAVPRLPPGRPLAAPGHCPAGQAPPGWPPALGELCRLCQSFGVFGTSLMG